MRAFGVTRAIAAGNDASDPVGNELGDDRRVTHGEDARQTRTDWKTVRSWKRPEDQRKGGEGGQEDAHLLDLQTRKDEVHCLQVGFCFSCPVFSRSAPLPVNAAVYNFS